MTDNRRDFSNREFIEAVRAREPAGTPEIAEHVGCTRANARSRLIELYEVDEVSQKTVGGSYIWLI